MSGQKTMELCPCGSNKALDACCAPFILGQQIPVTAEQLMRSRYTAYTQANIPYIQATMRERAAQRFDPVSAQEWTKGLKWKRLSILEAFPHANDPERAFVHFRAYYIAQGRPGELKEVSEFRRIDGRWFYIGEREQA